MIISELIKWLQDKQKEIGDEDVCIWRRCVIDNFEKDKDIIYDKSINCILIVN